MKNLEYHDIYSLIAEARKARSDALGQLLADGAAQSIRMAVGATRSVLHALHMGGSAHPAAGH